MHPTAERQQELLTAFVKWLRRDRPLLRPGTVGAYLEGARSFATKWIAHDADALKWSVAIDHFESEMLDRNLVAGTIAIKIFGAMRYADFCKSQRLAGSDLRFIVTTRNRNDRPDKRPRVDWQRLSLGNKISEFLNERHAQLSGNTIRAYECDLARFANWFHPKPLSVLAADRLRDYLSELESNGMARSSLARASATLRAFCRWLSRNGVTVAGFERVLRFRFPRRPTERPNSARPDFSASWCIERDKALYELLATVGLFTFEITRLNLGDYRACTLQCGSRSVLLDDASDRAVREYVSLRKAKETAGPLFVNQRGGRLTTRSIGRIIAKSVQKRNPTDLRKLALYSAVASGTDPHVKLASMGILGKTGVERYLDRP